ncbi:hypothetical protein WJX72_010703 [[Myrmecia] bisecta]|uniref:Transmembrane and coiled-coil domain-containing protein 4 n=1 Tax=[Myrmecia] bisecta TaxID=41462 RepID=A0AAW1Q8T5_9CHLO
METDAGPTIVLQEFGSEEKYATAALFSLALHLTQVEAGAGREAVGTGLADIAWGQPAEDEADTDCDATADGDLDKAKSAAFWGWDCCGPGGLLERIFRALNIPERSWSGLKKLPEVGGLSPKQRDAYLRLVTQYMHVLDSALCIAKPAPDAAAPKNGGREESRRRTTSADSEQVLGMHTPNVRFYDARARVTLKRMAAWLNVPWEKVAAFEHLQAYQLLVPEEGTDKKREMTVWEKSIWAAKIGGAAVGAGALFAVTGGLAAPAIAAGMGAAIGLVGGASAATAAAGATGFLATTAGTAVLASGIGAAGGGVAGSRMARRIGDVKEFGFWEVTDPADVEGLSPSASNAGSVFSEESNGTCSASLKTDGSLSKRPSRGLSIATSGRTKSDAGSGPKSPSWWRRKKRKELPLLPVPVSPSRKPDDMHMSLTIGISGSIAQRDDFLTVWRGLPAAHSELFTLVWESPELLALNGAIADFLTKQAYQEVVKFTLQNFFYTGLVAAVAAPWALLSFSQLIDTAWAVVMDRAIKAGKLLAHVLMANAHGDRPVILIGYSMGARLVFHCLLELCRHNAKGIVEHAVMLGMPVSTRHERWVMARSVVAGRFVNGYSNSDWVLGLVYRGTNGFIKEAGGLCAVNCAGVENVNLTTIIDGHFGYQKKLSEILDLIDLYN